MTDREVAVLALAILAGAWLARPVPLLAALAAATLALLVRRPVAVCLAAMVLASSLGARAWEGVRSAPKSGMISARATLVSDPEHLPGGVRAELRVGGRRVQAFARGAAASTLGGQLAGERVTVRGRLRPIGGRSRTYLARRHIGSRLDIDRLGDPDPGGPVSRFTNALRRTLVRGASPLGQERRALFTGLVLGDDREQSPLEVDDFRGAGLSHLLAVSGQNVAFVLALASPLLRRLGLRSRFVAGLGIVLAFGVLTRWEPSVLRAVGMAAVAMAATTVGRAARPLRLLSLAVAGLVLIDPLLAGAVGFLLSVAACTGIAALGPVLERRLPSALAVTLAAQAGVTPLLVPLFGGVPLASIPANLLAGPVAGPVMVWGLVAGLPAGLLGGRAAELLHLPTAAALWWISGVASIAAGLGLGEVGTRGMVALGGAALALVIGRRAARWPWPLAPALAVVAAVAAGAFYVDPRPGPGSRQIASGVGLWRQDGAVVLVVEEEGDQTRLLAALRQERLRRVDVLVLGSGGAGGARAAEAVRHRARVRLTLAPVGNRVPGAHTLSRGEEVRAGRLSVTALTSGRSLEVRVRSVADAPGARLP
ncbi:MAG: ComEC/Rec2 family competence protein [Actinobacteria bacterium]|nr:ComEC/Rec2 family competence protein [Actinomycetota bacterium]